MLSCPFYVVPPISSDADFYAALAKTGFLLDFGEDGSGLMMKAFRRAAGYYIEVGASDLIIKGEIKVRSAALNGINLGYAASRPSANSPSNTASTRFTKMDASFVASSSGVLFKNIHATAGALSTRGDVTVTPALAVDGLLHVDLGGTRIQAPLRIHVRGDVAHPTYGP